MKNRRISKKQKRVKALNLKTARKISMHLVMGDQHDIDRAEAEKLRSFPVVPRLKQSPFPGERDFGWAGHWVDGEFRTQSPDEFVEMNVIYKTQAYYYSIDPRGNRVPRFHLSGLIETNVVFSSGLARELAALVGVGKLKEAREIALKAGLAGMKKLARRTGYMPAYMALHPDAMGTLSLHFGLWPVDPEKHCVIGRSAGGKPGKRGFRLIGDAYMAVLRHHRAIGLPSDLVRQPMLNMRERHPDDWSAGLEMDRVVRRELGQLPDGEKILKRANEYQCQAAHDWLERFERAGGYQQREYKKKMARRKAAATKLMEADRERIDGLNGKLVRSDADAIALRKRNEDMSEHGRFLESELVNLGAVLKQVPGETVLEAAARLAGHEASAEEIQRENVSLKKEASRLQVAVADSQNTRKENQQLRDELEKSGKTISELLDEIAPLRVLKKLTGKLIEALNKILLPPAVRSTIENLLVEIGELVGKPFNSKSAEKRKNGGPHM